MEPVANPWDAYAVEYGNLIAQREQANPVTDPVISAMLALLGDIAGREVLDACCGEGYFARLLATRGARVVGIDLSPRLIEMARAKDRSGVVDYRVADLSRPIPDMNGRFDRIGSHLALNDVHDYPGFAATLASLTMPGGRIVLAFNNPYSSVAREHIADYFESGALGVYGGLGEQGVKAHYYHRTLEDYLDAFLGVGLRLIKLMDVDRGELDRLQSRPFRFPRFMILAFDKP